MNGSNSHKLLACTKHGGVAITGDLNVVPIGQVATTSVNGDGLILRYYGKLSPKTSTGYTTKTPKVSAGGYSIKTPKNSTGYTIKTP